MLRHSDYTKERIRQCVQTIERRIYTRRLAVTDLVVAGPVGRISHDEAQRIDGFKPSKPGDQFGPLWATFWFRGNVAVPADWAGSRVDLLWDSQSEATLWVDGRSVQGLNMTHGDRPDATLLRDARGGESLSFQIEMACNTKFGNSTGGGVVETHAVLSPFHLRRCEIATFDPAAWELFYDARTLADLLIDFDADGGSGDKSFAGLLLTELNRFCNVFDVDDRETWPAARAILTALFANRNGTRQFEVVAMGHAHIDTAWLWPLAETHRKCERTFSTQTAYMRDYPEYRFACSQAYQYDVIKRRNPDLYGRIKDAVTAGQFVPVGGTWIEPDCNIPSGESLIRQFVFGQRYFEREFGRRCKEFWNPDVFGYNGQLPQIMNLCGITRFLTQKLSWNRFNKPQHHTFTWEGIDGSAVLAHFPPADTYNAMAIFAWEPARTHVNHLRSNAKLFKDHDRSNTGLLLYGYGDGGGGPTKDMFESIRRTADLQGVPRVRQLTSDEFFDRLEADLLDRPRQRGELYFEYHRGTYTSQALVKLNNRRAEQLLHDLELLATLSDRPYPRDEINALWEVLLLNQFHDILPGSSIKEVYDDSARQFADLFAAGERLIDDAAGTGDVVVNTIGFARRDVVEQGGTLVATAAAPFAAAERVTTGDSVAIAEDGDTFVLANAHLRATFAAGGRLLSLVHLASGRQSLSAEANVLELYDDVPTQFDAWDVDPFHVETRREVPAATSATIVRADPLRGELRFEYAVGKRSTLTQIVRLDADAESLIFAFDVDWREDQTLLKVAFPVNARAMNATYEMQFGHAERPTHYNTSFDLAKYEVPFHKWFDLGEPGFGVAILTDSKYGGSTFDSTVRVSLLRSPMSPDPTCDRGRHRFMIAVMPHAGDWRDAGVVGAAAAFNAPLRAVGRASSAVPIATGDANLVVDTIKRAEDSDAVIVRLYECHGRRGTATLTLDRDGGRVTLCNALEDAIRPIDVEGRTFELAYEPHRIFTLRID